MPQRRQSSSWHHSLANERSELRQRIRAARVRYFQRTTLSTPGKYDAVGLFEPLQVGLAAQGDRELLVLALEARQGARRQRRAVLEQHVQGTGANAMNRKFEQYPAPQIGHGVEPQPVQGCIERQVVMIDRDLIAVVGAQARQDRVSLAVGLCDHVVVLQDAHIGIVGDAHDAEAVGARGAEERMAADDADAPGYSDARGPGTIFRPACFQHVRADAGLQAIASEQILVSPLHAVAIAVAERQAFLHDQSAIFAGGPGRAVARSVESNGTRGELSQGNRYRGEHRRRPGGAVGAQGGQRQVAHFAERDRVGEGRDLGLRLIAKLLNAVSRRQGAERSHGIADGAEGLAAPRQLVRLHPGLPEIRAGDLRLQRDAYAAAQVLDAQAEQPADARLAAASRKRAAQHAEVAGPHGAREPDRLQIARRLAADFCGEVVCDSPAIGGGAHGLPVIIALYREVVPYRADLAGVVGEPLLKKRRAAVERLRDDLFASEEIAHHQADFAASRNDGNVLNGERPGWDGAALHERVVHEDVDGGREDGRPCGLQDRGTNESRLGAEVGAILRAADTHRAPPRARPGDRIAEANANELGGIIDRVGRIEPQPALAAREVWRDQAAGENAVLAEKARFEEAVARGCVLDARSGKRVIEKSTGLRQHRRRVALPGDCLYGARERLRVRGDRRFACARDRKSTRLNSSHGYISYAVFCLKKKKYNDNSMYMCIRKMTMTIQYR